MFRFRAAQQLPIFANFLAGCGGVSQLVVSECGKFAAVITTRLQVFVIDLKLGEFLLALPCAPMQFRLPAAVKKDFAGESRLLRVSLPIDIAFTDGESLFVLCATAGFGEPSAATKVLYEVSLHYRYFCCIIIVFKFDIFLFISKISYKSLLLY